MRSDPVLVKVLARAFRYRHVLDSGWQVLGFLLIR